MLGGGGLCPNILDFKNVSSLHFMDLKKLRWEGYAQIFHRLDNCWCGGMPTNFMDLKKCWWGGGYAKIFYGFEKKNVGGGGGLCQNILWT